MRRSNLTIASGDYSVLGVYVFQVDSLGMDNANIPLLQ
jgi:hypothetical protein